MFSLFDILKATGGKLLNGVIQAKIKGVSIDSRNIKQNDLFIAIKGKNFDGHDYIIQAIKNGASAVICSRNFSSKKVPVIKVNDSVLALGHLANYYRRSFDIPVIAVTGSNGKTTTKDMIAWVLAEKFSVLKNIGTKNNAIGLPLSLLNLKPGHEICVLEIGTNHFQEVNYLTKIAQPNIGIITNIGPAHLEFLMSLKGFLKEKSDLIKGLQSPAIGMVNADDPLLRKSKNSGAFKDKFILTFGIKNKAEFKAGGLKICGRKTQFLLNGKNKFVFDTFGTHNVYNALIAIAVARIFGLSYKEIAASLRRFVFPTGRLSFVKARGTCFIDDTYNSNPLSLGYALDALHRFPAEGRKIFFMGDMLELGSGARNFHRQAAEKIGRICDCFVAVGSLAGLTAGEIKKKNHGENGVFTCACAKEARQILLNKIMPDKNDIVLVKGSRRLAMEEIIK